MKLSTYLILVLTFLIGTLVGPMYSQITVGVASFPQNDTERVLAQTISWAEEEYGYPVSRLYYLRNQSVTTTNIVIQEGVRTRATINIGMVPDNYWFDICTLGAVYSDTEGILTNMTYIQSLQWVALHEYAHLYQYHKNQTGFFNASLITQPTGNDCIDYRRRYNEYYADNFATQALKKYLISQN